MQNKKSAFTLAEVLITLSVIGIVAALSIPTLFNTIGEEQYQSAWKKNYALISKVSQRVAMDEGGSLVAASADPETLRDKYVDYLNIVASEDTIDAAADSWDVAGWKLKDGTTAGSIAADGTGGTIGGAGLILDDGTFVNFNIASIACTDTGNKAGDGKTCAEISIDVNGESGPNVVGKDIYGLRVLENGKVMARGSFGDADKTQEADCNAAATIGWTCSAQMLFKKASD